MLVNTVVMAMLLATLAIPESGYRVDAGWKTGFCHIRVQPGAALVQVEERGSAPLSWPKRFDVLWYGPMEDGQEWMKNRIPCCPTQLVQCHRARFLMLECGYGYHWASGQRFWWLAAPYTYWHLETLD